MAFINKETFEIVERFIEGDEQLYFECDELIAPAIRSLNLKGYKTEFCCQSHPYPTIQRSEVITRENVDLYHYICGTYYVKKIEDIPDDIMKEFEKELNEGMCVFEIRNKHNISDEAYITFAAGYEPPSIPEEWWHAENTWKEDKREVIRRRFYVEDVWEYFNERLEAMKQLTEWADNLPVRNDN